MVVMFLIKTDQSVGKLKGAEMISLFVFAALIKTKNKGTRNMTITARVKASVILRAMILLFAFLNIRVQPPASSKHRLG